MMNALKKNSSKLSSKVISESSELGLPWIDFSFEFDKLPLNFFSSFFFGSHWQCESLNALKKNSSKLSSKVIWEDSELGLPWTDFIFEFDKLPLNFFSIIFLGVHCPCLMLNVWKRHFSKSSSKVIWENSELGLPWNDFNFEFDKLPLNFFSIFFFGVHCPC